MIVEAVAVKVAVVAPEFTVTDVGTANADVRVLESVTSMLLVAGAERVTVQIVEVEAARVMLPQ